MVANLLRDRGQQQRDGSVIARARAGGYRDNLAIVAAGLVIRPQHLIVAALPAEVVVGSRADVKPPDRGLPRKRIQLAVSLAVAYYPVGAVGSGLGAVAAVTPQAGKALILVLDVE
jgi:hypothetical protein